MDNVECCDYFLFFFFCTFFSGKYICNGLQIAQVTQVFKIIIGLWILGQVIFSP